MKKLFITILLSVPMVVFAQDASYTMYEMVQLTPNGNDNNQLKEDMKSHNAKFHSEGAHMGLVYSISSGPDAGNLVWMMGPLTYADLDTRPVGEDHDADWAKVTAHIEKVGSVEYWKRDDKISVFDPDATPTPMLYVRIWEVNNEYGFLVDGLLKQAYETVKAMEGDNHWAVWDNEFRQGNRGRHIATVSPLQNWAELDKDLKFMETFKKVHGEDAWAAFYPSGQLAWKDSYDEVWTLEAGMMAGE